MNKDNVRILVACNGELTAAKYPIILTGAGKVNAAMAAQREIDNGAKLIINVGTAGSSKFPYGSIVGCTKFVQRDWDTTALGDQKYCNNDGPVFEYGKEIPEFSNAICGTGDNFCTNPDLESYDIVDMEAYAIARVCHANKADFICLKFISDGANFDSARQWPTVLGDADKSLQSVLESVLVNI